MRIKREFPRAFDLFQVIAMRCGGLDKLKEERLCGNLKPTKEAVTLISQYIRDCPIKTLVRNIMTIKMFLGEEDSNTDLLKGVEKAIRSRQKTETIKGNHTVATQLSLHSLKVLIEDSEEINKLCSSENKTNL